MAIYPLVTQRATIDASDRRGIKADTTRDSSMSSGPIGSPRANSHDVQEPQQCSGLHSASALLERPNGPVKSIPGERDFAYVRLAR